MLDLNPETTKKLELKECGGNKSKPEFSREGSEQMRQKHPFLLEPWCLFYSFHTSGWNSQPVWQNPDDNIWLGVKHHSVSDTDFLFWAYSYQDIFIIQKWMLLKLHEMKTKVVWQNSLLFGLWTKLCSSGFSVWLSLFHWPRFNPRTIGLTKEIQVTSLTPMMLSCCDFKRRVILHPFISCVTTKHYFRGSVVSCDGI